MPQQAFSVMHGWMVDEIAESDLPNITVAELLMEHFTPYDFRNERALNENQFNAVRKYISGVAHLELIMLQFLGLKAAIESMIAFTSLGEDGSFSIRNGTTEAMAAINTLFSNVLVDGNRMVKSCERYLKKECGTASDEFTQWKRIACYLYDNDLIYMLSCKLRNAYEHETLVLNYTAIDFKNQHAYAVLDLEHELLRRGIPVNHPKLTEFIEYRQTHGEKLKRNIGTFIRGYFSQIQCLYTHFVFAQTTRIEKAYANMLDCLPLNTMQDSCIVIRNIHKKGFPPTGIMLVRSLKETLVIRDALDPKGIDDLGIILGKIGIVGNLDNL